MATKKNDTKKSTDKKSNDPCWDEYKKVGTKIKKGKRYQTAFLRNKR